MDSDSSQRYGGKSRENSKLDSINQRQGFEDIHPYNVTINESREEESESSDNQRSSIKSSVAFSL